MKKIVILTVAVFALFNSCSSSDDEESSNSDFASRRISGIYVNDDKYPYPIVQFDYYEDGSVREMRYYHYGQSKIPTTPTDTYNYSYYASSIHVTYNGRPFGSCEVENGKIVKWIPDYGYETSFVYDSSNRLYQVCETRYMGKYYGEGHEENNPYMFTYMWENDNIVNVNQSNFQYWFVPSGLPNSASRNLFFSQTWYALRASLAPGQPGGSSEFYVEWYLPLFNYFGVQPKNLLSEVYEFHENVFYIDDALGRSGRADLWEGYKYSFEITDGQLSEVIAQKEQRYTDKESVENYEYNQSYWDYKLTWK